MDPLLQIEKLWVSYRGVEAVRQVDLAVRPGEIVAILGANGAGKSSLLNAIMAALPGHARTEGEVFFDGKPIGNWPLERRVAAGLRLIPETRNLFGSMSVLENLRLGGFTRYRAGERGWSDGLQTVFEFFPVLEERASQQAGTLSGGQRQMLAIGRALMGKPRLLMLDEPSLGLAPRIVREMLDIVVKLRESGIGILLVEQNARAALHIADRGCVLDLGQRVLEGEARALASDPSFVRTYLGMGRRSPSQCMTDESSTTINEETLSES